MTYQRPRTALWWLWISIVVIVVDQYTKYWISSQLDLHESWDLMSNLRFFLSHNQGAAFSFLSSKPQLALYFFSTFAALVVLGMLFWLFCLSITSRWLSIAICFILGGAVGNLIDRIRFGYVIDFIDVYVKDWHWPIFNVADIMITVGALMLVIDTIWPHKEKSSK